MHPLRSLEWPITDNRFHLSAQPRELKAPIDTRVKLSDFGGISQHGRKEESGMLNGLILLFYLEISCHHRCLALAYSPMLG